MGQHVVALMGSHHRGGVIDTTVDEVCAAAREAGATTDKIVLCDHHVEFCQNCRQCCSEPGPTRGACVIDDDVDGILTRLEQADGLVLGSSVNFGDVNARTRQLLERMVGYAYWPVDKPSPAMRCSAQDKVAVLVTSSAAPALMTRVLARPLKTLRQMAKILGARPIASVVVGLAGGRNPGPGPGALRRARRAGRRLVTKLA